MKHHHVFKFLPANAQVRLEEHLLQSKKDLGLAARISPSNNLDTALPLLRISGDARNQSPLNYLMDFIFSTDFNKRHLSTE